MGNCSCSFNNTLDTEEKNKITYPNNNIHNKEDILPKIKQKFEKFGTIEYITQEEFDKILTLFPDIKEIKKEINIDFDRNEINQEKTINNEEEKLIEIESGIKINGDDDQFIIYKCPINEKYEFQGKGYQITNNFIYYGYINHNLSNGYGILINKTGNILSGTWINGSCTGKTFFKINKVLEFEGDFVNNKKEGYGIEKYNDGSIYEGEFKSNKKNGKGKCILNNGEIYEGEFVNDLYEGEGIYKWTLEGREYKGQFKKGNINGKGINKYSDGSIFEGYYKNGQKHGIGIYKWPNGKIIKGNWVNNKLHGNAFFEEDNKKFNITFRFGKIISVSESIDESKIVKFDINNIINTGNINDIEKYKCNQCNKIVYNPMKCCNCNNNYCLNCIKENDDNKLKKCKVCNTDEYETNSELIFDLVNNVKVFCDKCNKELNYESMLIHVHN